MPHRPCVLVKYPRATILLDCAVNLETLAAFLPRKLVQNVQSPLVASSLPKDKGPPSLKRIGGSVFIDAPLEVHPVTIPDVEIKNIDAILVSNWTSLVALPFITGNEDFTGEVYCTQPTKELGALVMEELLTFYSFVNTGTIDDSWRNSEVWKTFPKSFMTDPTEWKDLFSSKAMEKCFRKISYISCGETIVVNGSVECTAHSSGYAIGSCNWIIKYENAKFGYISTSSEKMSHMRIVNWQPFRELDHLMISSLARLSQVDLAQNCQLIGNTVVDTLKRGGNVLFPVSPVGYIYDLLEIIFSFLESGKLSREIPVYFISSVAASSLAFVNIYAEWLSEAKSGRVYAPEEPFAFNDLVKDGRIKVYENIYGSFSREFRTPCVVLTGHPSLRLGNAVHFMEMWGSDKRSSVIMTDPDYSMADLYKPYRHLQIRAYDFPIETRLNIPYVNTALLEQLKPKTLVISEQYTRVVAKGRQEPIIAYPNMIKFSKGTKLTIDNIVQRKRALIQPEILQDLAISSKKPRTPAFSCVRGFLSTYDNDFEILSEIRKAEGEVSEVKASRQKYSGTLAPERLMMAFNKAGIGTEFGESLAGEFTSIAIPSLNAEVRVLAGGKKTRICCGSRKNRQQIREILCRCLQQF